MESMVKGHEAVELDSLLEKVYRDGGYDFRYYKHETVMRRLERRLHATGARTYLDYMQFLDNHPEEYQKFAEYLTIKISSFFRSPYAFQQVGRLVLPELVSYKRNRGERSLRFWSTACARGEEPYSIAILLSEFLGRHRQDFDISIYATDISQWALGEAKGGIYSLEDIEGVPDTIRENYFTRCGEGYEVRSEIRRMVNFSFFDLTSVVWQPRLNLDCIFCCNVLIYLQKQLQQKVRRRLYDTLATPGYLVLGEVETLAGNLREKLECLDARAKIYGKNRGGGDVW
ncbi:Chemotaxis protein methyltransferase [subsurface metagenome]